MRVRREAPGTADQVCRAESLGRRLPLALTKDSQRLLEGHRVGPRASRPCCTSRAKEKIGYDCRHFQRDPPLRAGRCCVGHQYAHQAEVPLNLETNVSAQIRMARTCLQGAA